jgi:predicted amidohydrolase YtcJ
MIEKNIDILAHCNGDAAADHMINALEWARNNTRSVPDSRVIMVHSQNLR